MPLSFAPLNKKDATDQELETMNLDPVFLAVRHNIWDSYMSQHFHGIPSPEDVTKIVTLFLLKFPDAQKNFRRIQQMESHKNYRDIANLADMGVSLFSIFKPNQIIYILTFLKEYLRVKFHSARKVTSRDKKRVKGRWSYSQAGEGKTDYQAANNERLDQREQESVKSTPAVELAQASRRIKELEAKLKEAETRNKRSSTLPLFHDSETDDEQDMLNEESRRTFHRFESPAVGKPSSILSTRQNSTSEMSEGKFRAVNESQTLILSNSFL